MALEIAICQFFSHPLAKFYLCVSRICISGLFLNGNLILRFSLENLFLDQVVYAKTDVTAGSKGITAFIIEKGVPGYAACTDTTCDRKWKRERKY